MHRYKQALNEYLSDVRSTRFSDVIGEGESFSDLIVKHHSGHPCHRLGICPTQTLWGVEKHSHNTTKAHLSPTALSYINHLHVHGPIVVPN